MISLILHPVMSQDVTKANEIRIIALYLTVPLIICSFQIEKFSPRSKGCGVSSVIVLINPPSSLVSAMIIFHSSISGWESVLVRIPSTAAAASAWMTPIVSHRFVQMLRHVFCAQLIPLWGHSLSQALFELHLWVINWVSSSLARGGCPNLFFTDDATTPAT